MQVDYCFNCSTSLIGAETILRSSDPLLRLCYTSKPENSWAYTSPYSSTPTVHQISPLQSSRHTVTLRYFYPVAEIHLICISKLNFKPLSQITRSDLSLLRKLRFNGLSCIPQLLPRYLYAMGPSASRYFILGFFHPSPFQPLHLHLIIPPIRNFAFFRSPHFVSLDYVLHSIDLHGSVLRLSHKIPEKEHTALFHHVSLCHNFVIEKQRASSPTTNTATPTNSGT